MAGGVSAQQGILLNRDIMMLSEMTNISQSSFQYGTARSMALSGAITSLGGDATSMMVNPAGLGMSRSTEFTITPLVSFGENSSNFAMSNVAAVFSVLSKPKSKLLAFNIGIGLNRVADYNYSYTASSSGKSSIAYLFAEQLNEAGVNVSELKSTNTVSKPDWSYFPSDLYGAACGYKQGLVDGDETTWTTPWLNSSATIDQQLKVKSEGSAWEFDISGGANISNKLYIGFTLGIQSIHQRIDLIYGEDYIGNESVDDYLHSSYYSQAIITDGSGVNVKFGAVYRPMEWLRVGVSYHTPTYYNLNRTYQASVGSVATYEGNVLATATDSQIIEDFDNYGWGYRSSGKFLAGVSMIVAKRGLIAFDYQLDQYGNTTIRSTPEGVPEEFYDASDIYQNQHTIKVGAEYKIMPQVALRAGYAWSSELIKDASGLDGQPTLNSFVRGSFGVGIALSPMAALDLTYMAQYNDYSDYTIFYGSSADAQSGSYSLDLWQHNIALTLSIRL